MWPLCAGESWEVLWSILANFYIRMASFPLVWLKEYKPVLTITSVTGHFPVNFLPLSDQFFYYSYTFKTAIR